MEKTQLESARQGIVTKEMKEAALAEGVSPEFIRDGLVAGNIIICHNIKHGNGRPLAVGKGSAPRSTPISAVRPTIWISPRNWKRPGSLSNTVPTPSWIFPPADLWTK